MKEVWNARLNDPRHLSPVAINKLSEEPQSHRQQETSPHLIGLGQPNSYGKLFLRLLPSFLGECLHCFTHASNKVECQHRPLAASLASFSDHIPPVPLPSLCSLGMGLKSAKAQPGGFNFRPPEIFRQKPRFIAS